MKTTLLTTMGSCLACAAFSQSGPYHFSGAAYLAGGQVGLLTTNAEAAIVLPALIPQTGNIGWSAAMAMRPGLQDLREVSMAGFVKASSADWFGIGLQYTGIEGYQEQRISASYARSLAPGWHAGVQVDMNRNAAVDHDTQWAGAWSASFVAPLAKPLTMSVWIYNPTHTGKSLDLPTLTRIGLRYTPVDQTAVGMEMEKDWQHPLRFKAGIAHAIHPSLTFRIGASTNPALAHAGITWMPAGKWAVTAAWRHHMRLGSSLGASVDQTFRP